MGNIDFKRLYIFTSKLAMGIIRVRDIKIHTNHGCMVEEEKIGSEYIVHVEIKTDLSESSLSDKLEDTIDYVAIHSIVYAEMMQRSKLLEVVVQRIIDRIMKEHLSVTETAVEVAKINPPIGGDVGYVSVERKGRRT